MKKIILLHFILFFSLSQVKSQVAVPSPNVASISERAIIPVSGFTGQADVNVPLYTVKYKDLSVPISINYNSKGNKVKEHPGFVGLGWSMASGGVIFRKVNGGIDEFPGQKSYMSKAATVAENYNNLDYIKKCALDGIVGGDFSQYDYDGMPDEFIFNFNGYSGVFYFMKNSLSDGVELIFRSNGAYKLKGEILEIKDDLRIKSDTLDFPLPGQNHEYFTVARCIYSIKITDDLGFVYLFGNSEDNIEFGNPGNFSDSRYSTANTWHLSKITSPNGYSVDFTYEKKGKLIIPDTYRETLITSNNYKFSGFSQVILAFSGSSSVGEIHTSTVGPKSSYYFNYPSYLKSIRTPEQEVTFQYSECNDLNYDLSKYINPTTTELFRNSEIDIVSSWRKLDYIKVANINKTIKFLYTENNSERLKLNQVVFGITNGSVFTKEKDFSFSYNALKLSSYESNKSDHWGFYNGKIRQYNADTYYSEREPDSLYLQAEMLQQIKYPNGGYMKLVYEAHDYNKVARQYPFVVDDQSGNVLAGGLRIKSIEAKTDLNTVATKIDYFYTKNYIGGGITSSGVLSGVPKYAYSGSIYTSYNSGGFWSWSSASSSLNYQIARDKYVFPLGTTNGAHVTYTEVTEKINDGYISTIYTNHDNGYKDRSPTLMHSNFDSESLEDPFITNQAYRGLPLFVKTYSRSKILVKEKQNLFATDVDGLNVGVPFLQKISESLVGGIRASSGKFPVSPALLNMTTETDYSGQNAIINSTILEYNTNNKIYRESSLNSKGETLIKEYLYADKFSVYPNIYAEMVNANLVGLPIETTQYLRTTGNSDKIIANSITSYNKFNDLILPEKKMTLNVKDGTYNATVGVPGWLPYDLNYQKQFKFSRYDAKGNIVELQQKDGAKEVYLWGYNKTYPVARITEIGRAHV